MTHTLGPWKAIHEPIDGNKWGLHTIWSDTILVARTCFAPSSEANAEFIVRACNSHDELLEALKYALKTLQCQPNADDIAMYPLQSAIANAKKSVHS